MSEHRAPALPEGCEEAALLASGWRVVPGDPLAAELALLHARHHHAMHADTPPESIHMLPPEALAAPGISFFVLRDRDGAPAGMAALKPLASDHLELKSMHVLAELRGRGLARLLLRQLIAQARAAGARRLSLETGAQPSFAAARALFGALGFRACPPFGSYGPDPMSAFMTLDLTVG